MHQQSPPSDQQLIHLPLINQVIRWMHAVCRYPVKSTWLKPIKAGNFIGWPLLTDKNVSKYYPNSDKTVKGHLNKAWKNICSTKRYQCCLALRQELQDVYRSIYNVRETIFSDQAGQFPRQSQRRNKYDMQHSILEPIKSRNDGEMICTYDLLIKHLIHAGDTPKKHTLDNKICGHTKDHITHMYKFTFELAPPGCHWCNGANVVICSFKSHFLSSLALSPTHFHPANGIACSPKLKSH
eukprot:CCRYP_010313-RA/>CCRYP_010313-RA protein AED:0.41 eAED:0.44 QI:0/0/0/1/0/0/3/0/238